MAERNFEPIIAKTHKDLARNLRKICARFNENPDLARLVFVNPILAFEDVGVQLNAEMKRHIMERIRFPPKLKEKTARLERELKKELSDRKLDPKLPLTGEKRAHLLFGVLKLRPLEPDAKYTKKLESNRTKAYAKQHPLVAKLAEYERSRQGSLIFHTRESYEEYKAGKKKHRWIKAVRFKI